MIFPLSEAFLSNDCSAVLCTRRPRDESQGPAIVGFMTYTKDISEHGDLFFLRDIVVSEAYRNQRIASKCISSFIIYTHREGKNGFRLHTKEDNTFGKQLFNHFGNVVQGTLPPIMQIPRECVSMPQNVALFAPEHMNKAYEILSTQLNWSSVQLLSEIAFGKKAGAEGLVCLDKNQQVSGIALYCTGFSTISCTTNTHVNTIVTTNMQDDIAALIQGIQHRHKKLGRLGDAILDFRDNAPATWGRLQQFAEGRGATPIVRANANMVSGSIGGTAFKRDALKVAQRTIKMTASPAKNGEDCVRATRSSRRSKPNDTLPTSPHLQLRYT